MKIVKLNRIKTVLAEIDKQGKWLVQQLGKGPATVSKWCTNAIQPDLKTLVEMAEILNINISPWPVISLPLFYTLKI